MSNAAQARCEEKTLTPSPRERVHQALISAGLGRVCSKSRMRGRVIIYGYDQRDARFSGLVASEEVAGWDPGRSGFAAFLIQRAERAESTNPDDNFVDAAPQGPVDQSKAGPAGQPDDRVRQAEELRAFDTAIAGVAVQYEMIGVALANLGGHAEKFGGNRELSLATTKLQEAKHWVAECMGQYQSARSCYVKAMRR